MIFEDKDWIQIETENAENVLNLQNKCNLEGMKLSIFGCKVSIATKITHILLLNWFGHGLELNSSKKGLFNITFCQPRFFAKSACTQVD